MSTGSSSWITQKRRLALYLRDKLTCVYCLRDITQGISLSLDHVIARNNGGTHKSDNLVTCCVSCNSRKQDNDIPKTAVKRVKYQTSLPMAQYLKRAEDMIKEQGYMASLEILQENDNE